MPRRVLLPDLVWPLGLYVGAGVVLPRIEPSAADLLLPGTVGLLITYWLFVRLLPWLVAERPRWPVTATLRRPSVSGLRAALRRVVPRLALPLLVLALVIETAPMLFGAATPVNWWGFDLAVALLAVASFGLALVLAVLARGEGQARLVGLALFLLSALCAGPLFPAPLLPTIPARMARVLPASLAMTVYEVIGRSQPPPYSEAVAAAILLAEGVIGAWVAVRLWRLDATAPPAARARALLALLVPVVMGVLLPRL